MSDLKITRTVFTSLVAHFMLSFLSFLTFFFLGEGGGDWGRGGGRGGRLVIGLNRLVFSVVVS